MRADLVDALAGAGVENLQAVTATLRDQKKTALSGAYRAVNIVGEVEELMLEDLEPGEDYGRLFLLEATGELVVHPEVRAALKGIAGLAFEEAESD